jgi:hypothetical protein
MCQANHEAIFQSRFVDNSKDKLILNLSWYFYHLEILGFYDVCGFLRYCMDFAHKLDKYKTNEELTVLKPRKQ